MSDKRWLYSPKLNQLLENTPKIQNPENKHIFRVEDSKKGKVTNDG